MKLVAVLIYWAIVAIWLSVLGTVVFFYLRNQRAFGTTRLLLAVLAIDTLRNVAENTYFGLYFGGQYGFFSPELVSILGQPVLLVVPKLLNFCAGCLVLTILLLRWLPAAVRERHNVERTVDALRDLATHDGLTGLYNRSHFLSLGEAEWERARRYERPLSMLMIDIDLFKLINDQHGHDVGDLVIREVAGACTASTRGADIVARLGGEEFAMLLPETQGADAQLLAERLRKTVADLCIVRQERAIAVTVSIGVSEARDLEALSALIKAADIALYEAKRGGRNRVRRFDEETVMALGAN
jgi:diguanylate cyclase (GGDEF)-like protein